MSSEAPVSQSTAPASYKGLPEAVDMPDTCNEGITVRGMYEPCEAVAVAVRIDPDFSNAYPVCAKHCRGELVPLADVVRMAMVRA